MDHAHPGNVNPQPMFRRTGKVLNAPPSFETMAPQTQYPVTYGGPMPPVQRGARFLTLFVNFFARSLALVALVVLLELSMPPQYKPSQMVGGFLGHIDAAEMEAKMIQHAEYERSLAAAKAEVEKDLILARTENEIMANAYNAMYERMNKTLEIAMQMEAEHLASKEQVAKSAMMGQALAVTGLDLFCAFSGDVTACAEGARIKQDMTEQFDRATTARVGSIRDALIGDLPDPAQFRNVVRGVAQQSLQQAGS